MGIITYLCIYTCLITGTLCTQNCGKIDLLFVFDTSCFHRNEFKELKAMAMQIVNNIEIGDDKVRVGAMTFARRISVNFHLNRYSSWQSVSNAIRWIRPQFGPDYLHKAIRKVNRNMLRASSGDRPDARNIIIFVTNALTRSRSSLIINDVDSLKGNGETEIYVLCFGPKANYQILRYIASDPDSQYMLCDPSASFLQFVTQFKELLCPTGCGSCSECQNGGVCVAGECQCANGFRGDCCDTPLCGTCLECVNNGTCINNACACPWFVTGVCCETDERCPVM
ncbi:collagen alpha-6(VI) chain-like [Haliotis rufescens]|uniref:collagen alpha-6(VI) chain-like n=1 Tax=Haliotis rufescens TaxID=6454 RepID=UPI001EB07E7B|nr:collagen alpha-6(VI) chain-like [Haliotis rufescens]